MSIGFKVEVLKKRYDSAHFQNGFILVPRGAGHRKINKTFYVSRRQYDAYCSKLSQVWMAYFPKYSTFLQEN